MLRTEKESQEMVKKFKRNEINDENWKEKLRNGKEMAKKCIGIK